MTPLLGVLAGIIIFMSVGQLVCEDNAITRRARRRRKWS